MDGKDFIMELISSHAPQVLAPSSAALKEFFATWGPAKGLNKEQIFALPQFKEVMESHIIPGAWMTGMSEIPKL